MAFVKLYHRQNSKGNRIYFVQYKLKGQGLNKFTIGNVSPRRAKDISERIRAMVIQGVDPHEFVNKQTEKPEEKSRLRLSELEKAYLKHCSISNHTSTIELKKNAYNSLRSFAGNCYADEITPEVIEAWMASQKISKTTINIKLRTIRAMFNWGFQRESIDVNPFKNGVIKQYKVPDSDPEDYFTLQEIETILKTLKKTDETMWRFVLLALETGGRLAELTALYGKDIDLKNARILFRGPTTKTGQRRYVPLRPLIIEEIKSWKLKKDQPLFEGRHDKSISRKFRVLLDKLKLRNTSTNTRSFHTLRHTYASLLLMSGVNIFVVSRWMGHSSVNVTEKHYGHLIPDAVKVELPWQRSHLSEN